MQTLTSVIVLLSVLVGLLSNVAPVRCFLNSDDSSVKDKVDALLRQQLQEDASLSLDDNRNDDIMDNYVPLLDLPDSEDDTLLNARTVRSDGSTHARYNRDPEHKFLRFGRDPPEHKFMRFGRLPEHKFLRFGREKEHKFMRFGRYADEQNKMLYRQQRDPQHNFMRFGRSAAAADPSSSSSSYDNLMRLTRQPEHNFLRFGRNSQGVLQQGGAGAGGDKDNTSSNVEAEENRSSTK